MHSSKKTLRLLLPLSVLLAPFFCDTATAKAVCRQPKDGQGYKFDFCHLEAGWCLVTCEDGYWLDKAGGDGLWRCTVTEEVCAAKDDFPDAVISAANISGTQSCKDVGERNLCNVETLQPLCPQTCCEGVFEGDAKCLVTTTTSTTTTPTTTMIAATGDGPTTLPNDDATGST